MQKQSQLVDDVFSLQDFDDFIINDTDLLKQLFDSFSEDLPDRMQGIQNAIDTNDSDKLRYYSHALKGMSQTICAIQVKNYALLLEEMGRHNTMENASVTFKELKAAIERLEQAIHEMLNKGERNLQ